ncbi:demethoxyubiquinone hydroxylase family protein [Asticcacaulis sp. 201]|uniref:demethoxyubiquinone hydroxylase family protein n=1 Tax=Asticcacaulis sp. 201 TaxID=3028787 RepID=UPI002916CC23|nr:demethoxyubiquinone hydroxylase family protein [Asticcacaulis sp. 201]MDV6330132.1 demethoxyubiquinone hydroxylase family protein [Asticcacaulis sp. 201]
MSTSSPSVRPVPPRPGYGASRRRLEEILRVDHAGELAAVQIYKGQSMVFSDTPKRDLSRQFSQMQGEEQVHLDAFEGLMRDNRVRPTAMTPIWRLAALGLGVGTALLGEKAAHACTEAVESVIGDHYNEQIDELSTSDPDLAARLRQFRDDELGHHDRAVDQGAREAPGYPLLSALIKTGCRVAIKISEKI